MRFNHHYCKLNDNDDVYIMFIRIENQLDEQRPNLEIIRTYDYNILKQFSFHYTFLPFTFYPLYSYATYSVGRL